MVFRIFFWIITYSTKTKNIIFIYIRNATYIYTFIKMKSRKRHLNLVYFKISNSDFDKNQYLDCPYHVQHTVQVLFKSYRRIKKLTALI